MNRVGVVVAIAVLAIGCADRDRDVTIRLLRSETYTFSRTDRRVIAAVAGAAFTEVRRLLPGTPPRIEITVRPGTDVIPETGETGAAMPPAGVMLTLDPSRPGGVVAIANTWLRACMFHELHHLARDASDLVAMPTSEILSMSVVK